MSNNNEKSTENMQDFGIAKINGKHGKIYCMSIIGQVEGHNILPQDVKSTKYEHLIPALVATSEDENIEGVLIMLNTMGGDVEAGLALAELIAGLEKPTVSMVLGGGHSIGVPLAVASKYSFIAPTATMTIHPVRMNGTIITVPQSFDYLMKTQERVIEFIVSHSRIEKENLTNLMMTTSELANDAGTIMYGQQAVENGLIDAVGTVSDALKKLHEMIETRKEETR